MVPRAARLLLFSSGLQHPTTSTPKGTGQGGRAVSPTSFTCHLLPTQHSPNTAPMDSQCHPPPALHAPLKVRLSCRAKPGSATLGPGDNVTPPSQSSSRKQQLCLSAQRCLNSSDNSLSSISSGCPKLPAHPRKSPALLRANKELKCNKKKGKTFPGRAKVRGTSLNLNMGSSLHHPPVIRMGSPPWLVQCLKCP